MRRKRKTTLAAILAAVLCSLSLTAVTAFAEPGDGGGVCSSYFRRCVG